MKRSIASAAASAGDAITFVCSATWAQLRGRGGELAARSGCGPVRRPEEARRPAERQQLREVTELRSSSTSRSSGTHRRGGWHARRSRSRGIGEEIGAELGGWGGPRSLWSRFADLCWRAGLLESGLVEEAGLGPAAQAGGRRLRRVPRTADDPHPRTGRADGGVRRPAARWGSEAKYLNSPDSRLYKKGETLFGLDRARRLAAPPQDVGAVSRATSTSSACTRRGVTQRWSLPARRR